MKKIACAALKLKSDGRIFHGKRHNDCIFVAHRVSGEKPVLGTYGFLTTDGKFVDRKQAMDIAIEAGQVGKSLQGTSLYSEDIY